MAMLKYIKYIETLITRYKTVMLDILNFMIELLLI